eukprot:SAG22_NODE_1080_length_5668_cov_3.442808_3_plen_170_part_00
MAVQLEVLGPANADTLHTKGCLADLLKDTGEHTEARRLYEEALTGFAELGLAQRTNPLSTMMNFAILLIEMGDLPEARKMSEKVLAGRRAMLGPQHVDTLNAQVGLAEIMMGLKDLSTAAAMLRPAIDKLVRSTSGNASTTPPPPRPPSPVPCRLGRHLACAHVCLRFP